MIPVLTLLFLYVQYWKRKKQRDFGDLELIKKLSPEKSVFKPILKLVVVLLALTCLIIGLVCVYADLTYQTGLDRMWSRSTRLDMYWPALANIGEQAVLNKEIYCQGSANAAQDAQTFGYQERFAEYRYKPSHSFSDVYSLLSSYEFVGFCKLSELAQTSLNHAIFDGYSWSHNLLHNNHNVYGIV